MNKTAFVIFEKDNTEPDLNDIIVGICSTKEKADRAIAILNAKNQYDFIKYYYEEHNLDQITIFL